MRKGTHDAQRKSFQIPRSSAFHPEPTPTERMARTAPSADTSPARAAVRSAKRHRRDQERRCGPAVAAQWLLGDHHHFTAFGISPAVPRRRHRRLAHLPMIIAVKLCFTISTSASTDATAAHLATGRFLSSPGTASTILTADGATEDRRQACCHLRCSHQHDCSGRRWQLRVHCQYRQGCGGGRGIALPGTSRIRTSCSTNFTAS